MEKEKKCPECTHRIKKRTEEETKLMINRLNRTYPYLCFGRYQGRKR